MASRESPEQLLLKALFEQDVDGLQQQLEAGVDPNGTARQTSGPFWRRHQAQIPFVALAASAKWAPGLRALLDAGAYPSQQVALPGEPTRRGPLINLPAANGSLETLEVLLSAGVSPEMADHSGLTPLMSAAHMGHEAVVSRLTSAGASIDAQDEFGYTALMFAANAGQAAAARTLLEAGADANAEDHDKSTAIMFAAQHAYDDVIAVLLQAGADPFLVGSHGLSAVDFAEQNGHQHTRTLLVEAQRAGT